MPRAPRVIPPKSRQRAPGQGASKASQGIARRTATSWWQTHFDAQYLHEYEPLFDPVQDRREVGRLLQLLAEFPTGSRVLDCPCGQGRHAHLLAEAGYNVDGLDYSADLLKVARKRGTGRLLRYTQGDMRKLPPKWTGRFSIVIDLFTSFGFFDNAADDQRVLCEFARVLEPGGVLVWHGGSRDGVMARFLARDWWSTSDGTVFGQERTFDPLTGFLTVQSTWCGPKQNGERTHRIRLYTASELAERMREVGLIVEQSYDAWSDKPLSRRSSEMLLVARKD